jgi:hypothetical protein
MGTGPCARGPGHAEAARQGHVLGAEAARRRSEAVGKGLHRGCTGAVSGRARRGGGYTREWPRRGQGLCRGTSHAGEGPPGLGKVRGPRRRASKGRAEGRGPPWPGEEGLRRGPAAARAWGRHEPRRGRAAGAGEGQGAASLSEQGPCRGPRAAVAGRGGAAPGAGCRAGMGARHGSPWGGVVCRGRRKERDEEREEREKLTTGSMDGSNRSPRIQTRARREGGREVEEGEGGYSLPNSWVCGEGKWGRGAQWGVGVVGHARAGLGRTAGRDSGSGQVETASPIPDLACSLTKSFRESKTQTKQIHA